MNERKDKQIEQLLRAERGDSLSPGFKHKVMVEIEKLPAPELVSPPRTWRDALYGLRLFSTGEKVSVAIILLGLVLFFVPGISEFVSSLNWELVDLTVNISVGETVASASLLSLIAVSAGALFMAGAGFYSARSGIVQV